MNEDPSDNADIKQFYEDEGYVVIRGAAPQALCEQAKRAFIQNVIPDKRFFMRHASGEYERHVFTEAGFMKYPIMNIQELYSANLSEFRRLGLEVLTSPKIQEVASTLLGTDVKINHTMYFDGNQQTWTHRDSDYIEPEQTGNAIGVWVAAEDIHPGAGRFFVHSRSHRAELPSEWRIGEMDPNGRKYKEKVAEYFAAREHEFQRREPELKQGDAIVWSSLTFHGSLPTTTANHSRRSFTAHYIPAIPDILNDANSAAKSLVVNGVEITRAENQTRFINQLDHLLQADYPALHRAFLALRKIKRVGRQNLPFVSR